MKAKASIRTLVVLLGVTGLMGLSIGCSEDEVTSVAGAGIPAVKPPVESASPAGFVPVSSSSLGAFGGFVTGDKVGTMSTGGECTSGTEIDGFCLSNFKSRIYPDNGDGPTAILSLIESIDNRFASVNSRSQEGNGKACLDDTPTSYTLDVFGLSSETFYLQCYDEIDSSSYLLFGKKDGVWYLIEYIGASARAIKVTPVSGASGEYDVEAYISVGKNNASDATTCSNNWDGCSYGVMALKANSNDKSFEFTAAGIGFGFCGVHIKSDGTYTYVSSSEEAGGGACEAAADTACLLNSDLSNASGNCGSLTTFELTTLGRQTAAGTSNPVATWAASEIPSSGGNVTIDGSSTDALHFLETPTEAANLGLTSFSVSK